MSNTNHWCPIILRFLHSSSCFILFRVLLTSAPRELVKEPKREIKEEFYSWKKNQNLNFWSRWIYNFQYNISTISFLSSFSGEHFSICLLFNMKVMTSENLFISLSNVEFQPYVWTFGWLGL
jgi:hypothetical protein